MLLDDPVLVALLTRYLTARGYRHGPLFRAEKNYVDGSLRMPLSRNSGPIPTKAQVSHDYQLRHVNAIDLVSAGDHPVPPQTRQRLDGCSATPTNAPLPPTRRSAPGDAEGSPGARQWTAHGLGRSPARQGHKG